MRVTGVLRRRAVTALVALVAVGGVGPALAVPASASPASASGAVAAPRPSTDDSVPDPVADFATDQLGVALQARYAGSGVDYSTATAGEPRRVMMFTEDARAGREEAHPLISVEQWEVPVAVSGAQTGLAILAFRENIARVRLVGLIQDAALATAVAGVPRGVPVVRDPQTSSWFSVRGSSATVLSPGSTGLKGTVPLSSLRLDQTAPIIDPVSPTTVMLLAILAGSVALVLLALVVGRAVLRREDRRTTT